MTESEDYQRGHHYFDNWMLKIGITPDVATVWALKLCDKAEYPQSCRKGIVDARNEYIKRKAKEDELLAKGIKLYELR